MTHDDLLLAIRRAGLTVPGFARLTGLHPHTLHGWGRERTSGAGRGRLQPVPPWAPVLLDALARLPPVSPTP